MYMDEMWEALEYTNLEPPVHLIMRPVAQLFGFKFAEVEARHKPKKYSSAEVGGMMAIAGKPKPKEELPLHIRNSKTFNRLVAEME